MLSHDLHLVWELSRLWILDRVSTDKSDNLYFLILAQAICGELSLSRQSINSDNLYFLILAQAMCGELSLSRQSINSDRGLNQGQSRRRQKLRLLQVPQF